MARIEHFALFADDLESLKTFYTDVLGLRVILDNSKAPIAGYFLADDGGSVIELIARPPGTPVHSTRYMCHAAFLVDDYDKAKKSLEGKGMRFETDTEVRTDSVKTGFFDDPQGNRLQIVWRSKPLGR